MRHNLSRSLVALLLALPIAAPLSGCPDETAASVSLTIEASATSVVADGENTVAISVTAAEGDSPATGVVTLTTNRGSFSGGGQTLQENLSGGQANVTLVTCDSGEDASCAGVAQVRADMGTVHRSVTIRFDAATEGHCDPDDIPVESCAHVETCLGLPCGDHGLVCDANGECTCPGGVTNEADAHVPQGEYACGDGIDHDCDGFIDCRDTDCEGQPCADHGKICEGGLCVCPHGFASYEDVQEYLDDQDDLEGNERFACGDGVDWMCAGLTDCDDPGCEGLACGEYGRVCVDNSCVCPGGVTNESMADVPPGSYACGDGIDHDCDGLIDCADPDCHTQPCAEGHICDIHLESCMPDPGLEQVTFWFEGPARVLASEDTTVRLMVELRSGDSPLRDQEVTFEVDAGHILANDLDSYTATTNALGEATVVWAPGTQPARDLRATATVVETGTSKWVEIQNIGLSSIDVQNIQHTTLGAAGSGYQETSLVSFELSGTDGTHGDLEIPDGVPVTFEASSQAGGLHLTRTDAIATDGVAQTTAVSGDKATTFRVIATATLAGVTRQVSTETLAVAGARPSQGGMTLNCNRRRIGSYALHDGTNSQLNIEVQCTVSLLDRHNNPIGVPTQVNFMAEGGSIESPVSINTATGTATTTYRSLGRLPRRVSPRTDLNEPSYVGQDGVERNPRDGFITIVAYTTGEEEFVDLNGNGRWDPGEPFMDMGEPFLDNDDSGEWAPGKPFIDHSGSGAYDGPNGQWDSSTLIWTETRILASGSPRAEYGSGFDPSSGINVAWNGWEYTYLNLADENLNPPPPNTTTSLSVTHPTSNQPVTVSYAGGGGTSFNYVDGGWGSASHNHIRWRRPLVCTEAPQTEVSDCDVGLCQGDRCTYRGRLDPFSHGGGHTHLVQITRTTRDEGGVFQIRAAYDGTSPSTAFYAQGVAQDAPEED